MAAGDEHNDFTRKMVNPGQLESVAGQAQAGATLYLKAGEHRLSRPLKIDKPLSLIGEGMDNTRVVGDGEPYVVYFEGGPLGDGPFVIRNLSFEHEGSLRANVVVAEGVEINVHRCRFNGGPDGTAASLCLVDSTRGLVANCESVQNWIGFGIEGSQAQLTLEANYCKENEVAGISYSGSAAGIARRNICGGNGAGIMVAEQAQPTLVANHCEENKHGIVVSQQAQPTLEHNRCEKNQEGIVVSQQAQPTLEHNTCEKNEGRGILYMHSAAGIARHNTCSGNRDGIFVGEDARPELDSNTCQGNTENDIYYASRTYRSSPQRAWGSGGQVAQVPGEARIWFPQTLADKQQAEKDRQDAADRWRIAKEGGDFGSE